MVEHSRRNRILSLTRMAANGLGWSIKWFAFFFSIKRFVVHYRPTNLEIKGVSFIIIIIILLKLLLVLKKISIKQLNNYNLVY